MREMTQSEKKAWPQEMGGHAFFVSRRAGARSPEVMQ